MAVTINVAGSAQIKIAIDTSGTLGVLGYTQDGAQIIFRGFFHKIFSDSLGGIEGSPRDYAFLAETADIILRLTKYDADVAPFLFKRDLSGAVGAPSGAGTLMMPVSQSYTHSGRLLINTATRPYNFTRVVYHQPIEINRGTKYSELLVAGTAHRDDYSGLLFNDTIA